MILVCLLGVSAYIVRGAEIKQPVSEVDVTEVSAPYRAALQVAGHLPANVQIAFLGEDRIAVTSHDGTSVPHADSSLSAFHLTIDIFELKLGRLKNVKQLRFETETIDSRVAALPSGRLIVDTGRELQVLDSAQKVMAEATAAQVCGAPADFPMYGPYRTALFVGSEQIGVIGFERPGPGFPPRPSSEPGWWCWFSTANLRPVAHTRASLGLRATARDLLVQLRTSSVSPESENRASIPTSQACDVPETDRKFPEFFLLHAEPASVFRCRKGAVSLLRGNQIRTIPLKGADAWFYRTDAWSAPLAIFVGGTLHVPLFGGNFTGVTKTRLVNYRSGASVTLPELKIKASPPVYAGQTLEYAISPNGRYVAVLHGSLLSVYETPAELLQQAGAHNTPE